MFQRLRTGWQLTKASLSVLKQDKELVVYPAVAAIMILGLGVVFFIFALSSGLLASLLDPSLAKWAIYLFIVLFLIIAYAISVFFEGAIISATLQRCEGRNPTLASGVQAPLRRIHHIILWALVLTVVTVLLQAVRNLGKGKSRTAEAASSLGASTLETAWRLVSFFVIPLILFENLSVFPALARSKSLFVSTWGENITAQVTTGALFTLIAALGILPVILAVIIGNTTLLMITFACFIIWLVATLIVSTTINGILIGLLYAYATKRKIPKEFDIAPQTLVTAY